MKISKSKVFTLNTAGLFLFGTMSRASSLGLFSCKKERFIRKHNNKSQTKYLYILDSTRGNNYERTIKQKKYFSHFKIKAVELLLL